MNAFERIAIGDQGEATTVVTLDITVRVSMAYQATKVAQRDCERDGRDPERNSGVIDQVMRVPATLMRTTAIQ